MKALGLVVLEKKIFLCFSHVKSMGANGPRDRAIFDPRSMIGRIYKKDHYTLLHTKYESSGPCGFGEEDFYMFCPITPRGGACMDPRGTVGSIYKEDHYTLLHTKYERSGTCGFGEKDFFFYVFPIVSLWELSVAMETRVPIRPAPKPNATFPSPH